MNGLSLRARLLAGVSLVIVVLVVVAAVITSTTRSQLIDQIDRRLASAASGDISFERGRDHDGDDGRDDASPSPDRQSDFYEGTVDAAGNLETIFVPNVGGRAYTPPHIDSDDLDLTDSRADRFTTRSEDGDINYRVLVTGDDRSGVAFVTALPLDDVEATIGRLLWIQLGGVASILAVLGIVTWWMLRHGIRPIKQMTTTATVIAGGDLSARADESSPAAESRELAIALNTMLGTIETSMAERVAANERLRRFVADASHELRTPVTTIRGYAELYRAGGLREREALDDAMRRTEQESIRMTRLVEDMLTLAKLDEQRPLAHDPVDLAQLARDAAADARATNPSRVITVEVPDSLVVSGDEDRLRQVLANLVNNAIGHTEPDVSVAVRVATAETSDGSGERAIIEVSDDGAGMPADVAERVTERFFRADPSRSRHRGGSGLGLSIVESTVEAHGGAIRIDTGPGHGTTVSFELPVHSING